MTDYTGDLFKQIPHLPLTTMIITMTITVTHLTVANQHISICVSVCIHKNYINTVLRPGFTSCIGYV